MVMITRRKEWIVVVVVVASSASLVGCGLRLVSPDEQGVDRSKRTTEVKVDEGSQSQVVQVVSEGKSSGKSSVSDRLGITALAVGCAGFVGTVVCVVLLVRHHRIVRGGWEENGSSQD